MTQDTNTASGAADLPEALRVPLDSLHADAGYLCGRLLNGSLTQEQVVESIRRRIDAAKLASLTAQAISAEPAGAGYAAWPEPEVHDEGGWHITYYTATMMRDFADRTHALRASHGQAPAQTADFTTLGAAMRAIQQAIGLIGDPADERMRAVRRVLRGAVIVAEDSGDLAAPAGAAQQAPAGATSTTAEQRRLIGVIADKIEDGTLFQAGIYSKKDLARFVRNMLGATPQVAPAAPSTPASPTIEGESK